MNSLNILSSRVIGQSSSPSPTRHRSRSQGEILSGSPRSDLGKTRSYSEEYLHSRDLFEKKDGEDREDREDREDTPELTEGLDTVIHTFDEKTPLLRELQKDGKLPAHSRLQLIAQRLFDAIAETLKVVLSALAAPGVYAARCFRDDDGRYSPLAPVRKIRRSMTALSRNRESSKAARMVAQSKAARKADKSSSRRSGSTRKLRSSASLESIASSTSESEADPRGLRSSSGGGRHTKSRSQDVEPTSDGNAPRRSIRIKLHNEDALRRQKQRRAQSTEQLGDNVQTSLADSLKSPTSPSAHKITKYPHVPVPPRPLIPPRLPSYTGTRNSRIPQKTLVLDLDETLIHSLAKGGRMSSGHMVEVKLSTPMTAAVTPGAPPTTVGPQHPILYYVHKRPHCDDFLRKVCKWYKLVIFTASVQEYADPVIDWLEQERKYFQARYYRQHCTLRNGAYIKDLSSVEPDLSKVIILDNSPMSYIFHEGKVYLSITEYDFFFSQVSDSG